jgi:hypothetical protein
LWDLKSTKRTITLHSLKIIDLQHRWILNIDINKINKVQWVDFKLENVLVSLHSLKTMGPLKWDIDLQHRWILNIDRVYR